MLALEVAVEPNEEDDDADANECRAERLSHVPQVPRCCIVVARDTGIEAEQLCNGDAYASEGE